MAAQFLLSMKTRLSGDTLDRILTNACERSYQMSFEGTEETAAGARKVIQIAFGDPDDRRRFRAGLRQFAETLRRAAPSNKRTLSDAPSTRDEIDF